MTRARTFVVGFALAAPRCRLGFFVYMYVESRATAAARLALRSDATVRVTVRPQDALFEPATAPRSAAGLLLLPGTPVDPIAYAPIARAIAARGYATAIVFLPRRGLASAESKRLATRAGEAMRALVRNGGSLPATRAAASTKLPASTRRVVISGASHSQFGFYGRHPFDGTPTISHSNQIAQTVDILLSALGKAASALDAPRAGEDAADNSPR